MIYVTEVFQCNAFNVTILIWLNLVWKTGYYTLFTISTSQHILVSCMTFECIMSCITKWWVPIMCMYVKCNVRFFIVGIYKRWLESVIYLFIMTSSFFVYSYSFTFESEEDSHYWYFFVLVKIFFLYTVQCELSYKHGNLL